MSLFKKQNQDIPTHRSSSQDSATFHHHQPPKFYAPENADKPFVNFSQINHRNLPQKPHQHLQRNSSVSDRSSIPVRSQNNKENILRKLSMIENVSQIKVSHDLYQSHCGLGQQRRQSIGGVLNSNALNSRTPQNERSPSNNISSLLRSPSQNSYTLNICNQPTNTNCNTNTLNAINTLKQNKYDRQEEKNFSTFDEKLSSVVNRLEKAEKEILKLSKKSLSAGRSPKKEPELEEIKEIYTMFLQNKKIQAKINDEHYLEVQALKKSIEQLTHQADDNIKALPKVSSLAVFQKRSATFQEIRQISQGLKQLQRTFTQKILHLEQQLQSNKHKADLDQYFYRKESLTASRLQRSGVQPTKNSKVPIEQCTQITAQQSFIDLSGNKVSLAQIIYYADQNGYLLDSNRYYIVDSAGKCIKLTRHQIDAFKGRGKVKG